MSTLFVVARHVGTASLAGIITGVVVGGLLGRLVMRVAGFTAGPALAGALTANGNRVGEITFAGTAAIVIFVGLLAGLAGGAVYAAVEPWLRPLRPWHGLAYGAGLLVTFAFLVVEPTNLDFRRFGSPQLNVAMFAALFVAFGVMVAALFDGLRAVVARRGTAARVTDISAFVALGPGIIGVCLVAISVAGIAEPLFPIVSAAGLLSATLVRWRRWPDIVGYGALAVPMVIGAARMIGGLSELFAGV